MPKADVPFAHRPHKIRRGSGSAVRHRQHWLVRRHTGSAGRSMSGRRLSQPEDRPATISLFDHRGTLVAEVDNGAQTIKWGAAVAYEFKTGATSNDQALIELGGVTATRWNEMYTGVGVRDITMATTSPNQLVGQVICRHGHTTGRQCGAINRKALSITMKDGNTLYATMEVKMESKHGDSGAGFYREWSGGNSSAYDILSAGETRNSTAYTYYFPWDFSISDLWEVMPCSSPSCGL